MTIQNAINATRIIYQLPNRAYGVPVRQCISAGSTSFITSTNLLSCTVSAPSTNPIICTFATGFDNLGVPIDYIGTFASSQSFTGLTANTTHYFYLERNIITGTLSCGKTTIVPTYSPSAPSSPVTGKHWFKTYADSLTSQPGMSMYEWSGSAWMTCQRVFIAELTTNATTVTSAANYALNRQYLSAWTSYSGQQIINFAHNLGISFESGVVWSVVARANSSDTNASLTTQTVSSTVNYGVFPYGLGNRLSQPFLTANTGAYWNGTAWVASGQILVFISIPW